MCVRRKSGEKCALAAAAALWPGLVAAQTFPLLPLIPLATRLPAGVGDAVLDSVLAGGAPPPPPWPAAQMQKWFRGGAAVDAEIAERFASDADALAAGAYDAWADGLEAGGEGGGGGQPLNALAGVIIADQFSRHVGVAQGKGRKGRC